MSTTVFISSTSRDLLDHRAAVAKSLLDAGFHPIDMANFMARPDGATTACLEEVAEADLFVGIYAWRYGYIPPGADVSITEQEFIEAERLKKPCFIFMVDENHPWPEEHREGGIGARLLRDFKARLDSKLVRTTFSTPQDLAAKVLASLQRWERKQSKTAGGDSQARGAEEKGGVRVGNVGGHVITGTMTGDITGRDKIGGDYAGRDIIHGDRIGRDNIVTVGAGGGQDPAMAQLKQALARWQQEIEARVDTLSSLDAGEKEDLKKNVARVADEAIKGEQAEVGKLERWLNTIVIMAPDILDVTAATLQNPFKGVGLVLQKISDRVKLERQKQT